jgi:hypothetical protein
MAINSLILFGILNQFTTFGIPINNQPHLLKKPLAGKHLRKQIKRLSMVAKIKSSVFIDALKFKLNAPAGSCVRGVLRDDAGIICRTIEKDAFTGDEEIIWNGLNDLPYGKYTLVLSEGEDEIKVNLVKRV